MTTSGKGSNCRAAACAAVALVIVLDFLSAYPTIERYFKGTSYDDSENDVVLPTQYKRELDLVNDNSAMFTTPMKMFLQADERIPGYPEITIPVDTMNFEDVGQKYVLRLQQNPDASERISVFSSPENTRLVVSLPAKLATGPKQVVAGYSGGEKISTDITAKKQMHNQQLENYIRNTKDLFAKHPTGNLTDTVEYVTQDHQLIIHQLVEATANNASEVTIKVEQIPTLSLVARLLTSGSRELDRQRLNGYGNPKILKSLGRLESALSSIIIPEEKSDESEEVEKKKKKPRKPVTLSLIQGAISSLFNVTGEKETMCREGVQLFKDDENLEIGFTLYKPRSKNNPIMYGAIKFEAIPFEVVYDEDTSSMVISATDEEFDLGDRRTIFWSHGFKGTPFDALMTPLINNLISGSSNDYNVIIVDYRKVAQSSSSRRRRSARQKRANLAELRVSKYDDTYVSRHPVPFELAQVMLKAYEQISVEDMHLVGHSLGAQVVAEASYIFTSLSKDNARVSRLTALDPAEPCFTHEVDKSERLDKTDADFVDVIHTSTKFSGKHPLGHKDYWVNGGKVQPSCGDECEGKGWTCHVKSAMKNALLNAFGYSNQDACSHMRAKDYFVNSITSCRESYKAIGVTADHMQGFLNSDKSMADYFPEITDPRSTAFDDLWIDQGEHIMGIDSSDHHPESSSLMRQPSLPELGSGNASGFGPSGDAPIILQDSLENAWNGSSNFIVPVSKDGHFCFS